MKIKDIEFERVEPTEDSVQHRANTDVGFFSVLNRMTGFGYRDTETSFRLNGDPNSFWLVTGQFDIRDYGELTTQEAADLIRKKADIRSPRSEEIDATTPESEDRDE